MAGAHGIERAVRPEIGQIWECSGCSNIINFKTEGAFCLHVYPCVV